MITTRLDELAHIDDGFLYYGDTVAEVTEQVRAILKDWAKAEIAAERGYRKTAGEYTWSSIADRFAALVEPTLHRTA